MKDESFFRFKETWNGVNWAGKIVLAGCAFELTALFVGILCYPLLRIAFTCFIAGVPVVLFLMFQIEFIFPEEKKYWAHPIEYVPYEPKPLSDEPTSYEIAVQNGYVGTVEQWLASLKK